MFKDYASKSEAYIGLMANGIFNMPIEFKTMLGGRVQPTVICELESDAEEILAMGISARMLNDYAVD